MARPFSDNPRKTEKLVAPVDKATKALAKMLAKKYFGGNEAEAIRSSVVRTWEALESAQAESTAELVTEQGA
jgi:hypothetical protein